MTRKRHTDSSLELLLDTICNTFGGILFVAILIIVMLRLKPKNTVDAASTGPSEAEQLELEMQHTELQGALDALTRAVAAAGDSPPTTDPDLAEQMKDLKGRQEVRSKLLEQRLGGLKTLAELQTATNNANRELQESKEKSEAVKDKKSKVESTLKSTLAKRTQKIEYSQARSSSKREVGIMLRYGRLYVWHRYGPSGERLGLNTDEFVVTEENAGAIHSTPNPVAGMPVIDSDASRQAIRARLAAFDSNSNVIAAIVWQDSFEEFRVLKDAVVGMGFQYRIMPNEPGEKVSDRGGSSNDVQ
jgi:hypothetical protein